MKMQAFRIFSAINVGFLSRIAVLAAATPFFAVAKSPEVVQFTRFELPTDCAFAISKALEVLKMEPDLYERIMKRMPRSTCAVSEEYIEIQFSGERESGIRGVRGDNVVFLYRRNDLSLLKKFVE